ncbi:FAD-dependent monooxygenase [Sphingomonas sp. BK580]|uniref:FAD-dependent monooxygenase n=1 Tax=Sphingomonas sp. BK580 TaxID=2586972 RepID=UPI0016177563|nr:FAD-dependent monooxygenase [Sphingomonas sp. BK580]MBB3691977.1 2-polyprenyl-6-methoxyphenol hydroxylase-like FAD-dependent oxidoreductase [Sphingomonas sp. BK580]
MVPSTFNERGADVGRRTALISGASFAGLATAYGLNRLGYQVTVVEAAAGLRRGGTPVDIEGETIAILERMGLVELVRAKALPSRRFEFKNADNTTLGSIGVSGDQASELRYEIHRDDLLDILFGAVANDVEVLFGRSISSLDEQADSVSVTLDDGESRDVALVVGCDGNRSNTRRLVFGDGDRFTHFMGGYFFLKVVPETGLLAPDTSEVFRAPGRMAMLNGYDDRTDIGFGFRTDAEIAYDYRDPAQQRRLIQQRCGDLGWKVPAMLAAVAGDDDFYFDRINQIRMPCWSRGRVVLVGDAGYCVSPLAGLGGSMAIIGAGRLAAALERFPDDHASAFRHYEDELRPFVEQIQQRAADDGMSTMCPADEAELAARDREIAAGHMGW